MRKKEGILPETFCEENFHAINCCSIEMKGGSLHYLARQVKECYQVSATETCSDLRDLSTLIIIYHEEMELWISGLIFSIWKENPVMKFWGLFFRIEIFLWNFPGDFVWLGFFGGFGRASLGRNYFQRKFPWYTNKLYPCNVQFHHRCINFRKECVGISYSSAILRFPLLQRQPCYKNACADTASCFQQSPHLKAKLNQEAQI